MADDVLYDGENIRIDYLIHATTGETMTDEYRLSLNCEGDWIGPVIQKGNLGQLVSDYDFGISRFMRTLDLIYPGFDYVRERAGVEYAEIGEALKDVQRREEQAYRDWVASRAEE